ncbi:hypothetical protein C486_07838 [Natrinema gari JCM 14663]|uniref:Uncharacterized protein n=1 Tax=Natrinema gari JCM 14663 TaxID=1230459 RepID=L9Z3R8_9EURY|nr:hypothetical protein C486_07838 [Natrinema gari JCM 14663]
MECQLSNFIRIHFSESTLSQEVKNVCEESDFSLRVVVRIDH